MSRDVDDDVLFVKKTPTGEILNLGDDFKERRGGNKSGCGAVLLYGAIIYAIYAIRSTRSVLFKAYVRISIIS